MSILVVDDSEDMHLLVRQALGMAGYSDIAGAASAEEAFCMLGLDRPDDAPFPADSILMDIVMRAIDGIEACRRIKKDARYADVPVIMVTVLDDPEKLQCAFEAGASDYIRKPVERTELVTRVRSALRLKAEMDRRKDREAELMKTAEQLKAANRILESLTLSDGLTGISNRRSFDGYMASEHRRAARDATHLSLVMMDIDSFKAINDSLGHMAGDECLREVAAALKSSLKRPADMAARYGGDEFAAILPETGIEGALKVARSVMVAVRARLGKDPLLNGARITVSIGAASTVPSVYAEPAALIDAADMALYDAKHLGGKRISMGAVG